MTQDKPDRENHAMEFKDIIYTVQAGVATIAINRPKVYNAFSSNTCEELIQAFGKAGWNRDIGVVVLTGAGDKAFCTGGDQSADAEDGGYGGRGTIGLPVEELQSIIRDIPKPVIARVNGYAIGGGNVLVTLCDLAIASDKAQFGQVGPKVGSVDPGFGTALLARVVGEKKAREIWYLCRRYSAQDALAMGLVNAVVPHDQLDAEVARLRRRILTEESSDRTARRGAGGRPVHGETRVRGVPGIARHRRGHGIQDMGAAGLTCSTCETAARAGTGIEIKLDKVPQRTPNMTSYELMLSNRRSGCHHRSEGPRGRSQADFRQMGFAVVGNRFCHGHRPDGGETSRQCRR